MSERILVTSDQYGFVSPPDNAKQILPCKVFKVPEHSIVFNKLGVTYYLLKNGLFYICQTTSSHLGITNTITVITYLKETANAQHLQYDRCYWIIQSTNTSLITRLLLTFKRFRLIPSQWAVIRIKPVFVVFGSITHLSLRNLIPHVQQLFDGNKGQICIQNTYALLYSRCAAEGEEAEM